MGKSIWFKFLVLLFSISLISLSAALFLREMIIEDFKEYLEGKTEDRIYRITAAIEGSYEKYSGWNRDDLTGNTIWALLLGYEVKIVDTDNNELINTSKAVENLSPLMKRRITAISGFSVDNMESDRESFVSYPLFLGGEDIGHLMIKALASKEGLGKETIFMKRSNRFLILSFIILGGLSLLVSLIFSKRLLKPIKRLTAAARSLSEGNSKSRVSVSGKDEISELGITFNTMANNLELQESLRKKLTSNIAHELRTPLSAMQGELEGMIDGLIKVDKERLLSLHEETNRLKTIIEGIEELSRAQASGLTLSIQTIPVMPFLVNIEERLKKLFNDKGVLLELLCDEKMTLFADPDKVGQILINLLSNALKATGKGGRVRIHAGMNSSEGFIEISDTGSGIKKEKLPFVFERFYKDSDGGLGLGLTIAKELAEAHGGRIEVHSDYGTGSRFTLYIPHT